MRVLRLQCGFCKKTASNPMALLPAHPRRFAFHNLIDPFCRAVLVGSSDCARQGPIGFSALLLAERSEVISVDSEGSDSADGGGGGFTPPDASCAAGGGVWGVTAPRQEPLREEGTASHEGSVRSPPLAPTLLSPNPLRPVHVLPPRGGRA